MIENKIAQSGLITIDLERWMPAVEDILLIDIAPLLFRGLILREKDYRQSVADMDVLSYADKYVGIYCSADAIIPSWAYMLLIARLHSVSIKGIYYGDAPAVAEAVALAGIQDLDVSAYIDQRLVIKGCGDRNASPSLYVAITQKLLPVAKSIMYGEPCSTVPIYKKKKS